MSQGPTEIQGNNALGFASLIRKSAIVLLH